MSDPLSKLETMWQVGRNFGVRDGMLRLGYELQRGTGTLSRKMKAHSAQGWDSWRLERIASGVNAETMLSARQDGSRRFFFSDARCLQPQLSKIIGPEKERSVLSEAEGVLIGKLPYFGALSFDCGFPPRWFQNPLTGQSVSPKQNWTGMRFASPIYGDLKFILEPSRFLFVYPLVRAYALSGDERFPEAFWTSVEDWARHSPPMSGPLWICGQESSLRILAWSFALNGFIHSSATTSERVALLVSVIAAHAWRTAQTIGYARSQRSNHLISEAVGLWTAGTLYTELKDAKLWQSLGAQLLREAVLDQIGPHGVPQQHSFNYQRMILHLLLWTLRLAEIHGAPLHPDIRDRTEAAFDFMRAWADPVSGLAPNYGSDDGSLIFPLASASYRDLRPLLKLGAAVLTREDLPQGPWDEAALWFGSVPAIEKKFASSPVAHADTGYFRLGNDASWAMIRAGQYARRPFQADQLHVDLWWKGLNLARDPGTYLYNGLSPWNNGFAETAVHNTVTVDGQDQMRRAGRFLWVEWAQASGHIYSSSNGARADSFGGEHNGYKRLGITHRRAVRWLEGAGWVIVDDIDGAGEHMVRLHWLLADLPFETRDSPFEVAFKSSRSIIRWNIASSVKALPALIRAGKQLPLMTESFEMAENEVQLLGWEAPTYGSLQPAVSLVCEARTTLPVRFVTCVLTNEHCGWHWRGNEIVIERDHQEIHREEIVPADRIRKTPELQVLSA